MSDLAGGSSAAEMITDKFVLVFDLDNTLIDTTIELMRLSEDFIYNRDQYSEEEFFKDNIDPVINHKLIREVLESAVKLRKGKVDAIVLLTNNSSVNYATTISMYLYNLFNKLGYENAEGEFESIREDPVKGDPRFPGGSIKHFFDYIMLANHPSRPKSPNPPKRLEDVEFMMRSLGKSTDNLIRRIFFFDDYIEVGTQRKHAIIEQMSPHVSYRQYIFIKGNGPFYSGGYSKDKPDTTDYSSVIKAFEEGVPLRDPPSKKRVNPLVAMRMREATSGATSGAASTATSETNFKGGYKKTRKSKRKPRKSRRNRK